MRSILLDTSHLSPQLLGERYAGFKNGPWHVSRAVHGSAASSFVLDAPESLLTPPLFAKFAGLAFLNGVVLLIQQNRSVFDYFKSLIYILAASIPLFLFALIRM